jgi:hypothetical protein
VPELRRLRAECQSVETQLSYLRRLVQGRHDIVTAEQARRLRGGDPDDVHGLVEQLPEILSDRIRAPGPGRLPSSIEPPEPSGRLVDRLGSINEAVPLDAPDALGDDDLAAAAGQLADLEGEVSALRRAMFDRIDAIEVELTRRYADGEAHVEDLLSPHGD